MNKGETTSQSDVEYLEACPGCKSQHFTELQQPNEYKIFLTDADEMFVTVGVCGCEQCGLIFLNPRMGAEKLFEYYTKQSRIPRVAVDLNSPFAVLMEMQIDLIESIKPIDSGMSILEIGCAEGFFLQSVERRSNNKIDLYGVELSEKYIKQAKANLSDATIYEIPLENVDFQGLQFDFIVLRHVFEHLRSPVECLNKIKRILAPDGVLYIEVPDSQNTIPSISRFYHHEHYLYFTPKILNHYLKACGFNPLVCERFEGNPAGSGFCYPVIRSVSASAKAATGVVLPGYAKKIYQESKARQDVYFEDLLSKIRQRLTDASNKNLEIGIFGAGPHTMELLDILKPENINFVKIFDNNLNKQGKSMRGIPIVKPEEASLKSVNCVLVSSMDFENEMVDQVKTLVGTQVEIITIYNNVALR